MKRTIQNIAFASVLALGAFPMFAGTVATRRSRIWPSQVRHELVMIPYYSVFDDLNYSVDRHGVVTLSGDVTQPVVKDDAARGP